jgi:hypothetical protein
MAMKHHNNVQSIPVIHTRGDAKQQVHFTLFISLAGTLNCKYVPKMSCSKIKQLCNTYPTTNIYGGGDSSSSKQVSSFTNSDMQSGDAQFKL